MKSRGRYIIIFLILISLLIFSILINLTTGSIDLNIKNIIDIILKHKEPSKLEYNILFKIRIPRIISAIILGGALSVSGFLIQTFFRNPIAGPYVLGISSGARLFVGFFILTSASVSGKYVGPFTVFLAAFAGSLVSMMLVLFISRKVDDISVLIVIGIMIGYIANAGTNLMVTFASENKITDFTMWSMGSFSGITWSMIKISIIIIVPTIIIVFFMSKPLSGYLLGENYARSMGIDIKKFRILLILTSSILSSCVTAFAGPVSFVGIAVPHINRMIMKTSKPKILIPSIFLLGSSFCLLCDLAARTLFIPVELPINTVTSFIGAPLVIWLMVNKRSRKA